MSEGWLQKGAVGGVAVGGAAVGGAKGPLEWAPASRRSRRLSECCVSDNLRVTREVRNSRRGERRA